MTLFRPLFALVLVVFLTRTSHATDFDVDPLTWGTYRPGKYFGVRARRPDSALFGFMWHNMDRQDAEEHIRHDADERDRLDSFGWAKHNGRDFGIQRLPDLASGVNITTRFLKSADGQSWTVRIAGEATETPGTNVSLTWYAAAPGGESSVELVSPLSKSGVKGSRVEIAGSAGTGLGKFRMFAESRETNTHPRFPVVTKKSSRAFKRLPNAYVLGERLPNDEDVWRVKDRVVKPALEKQRSKLAMPFIKRNFHELQETGIFKGDKNLAWRMAHSNLPIVMPTLPNRVARDSNVLAIQHVFTLPFELDLVFVSAADESDEALTSAETNPFMVPESFEVQWESANRAFDAKFERTFGLTAKGFSAVEIEFAKYALSNMMGSVGYWHGSQLVKFAENEEAQATPPSELFASVPSRSFFPRGFMWDEGFHQLLISKWDVELSQAILASWFAQSNEDGWIAREQILGAEPRNRVPAQFVAQSPSVANPPTLVLALHRIHERESELKSEASADGVSAAVNVASDGSQQDQPSPRHEAYVEFLRQVYPSVKRHTQWYLDTQTTAHDSESFSWRGRSLTHCLASGLDDFPRAPWLTPEEGHVDLHSWMVEITATMAAIAEELGFEQDAADFASKSARFQAHLDEIHWDEKTSKFLDYALHPNTSQHVFIDHTGYIQLFPFVLGAIPDPSSEKLGAVLDLLSDESGVWSDFGIRSLAESDVAFGTSEDYWRGAVWINLNFLVTRALHRTAQLDGPYQDQAAQLYSKLRGNLIRNMVSNFETNGFLWEQYDALTGKGRGTHPFTGWSSLIVLIMAEQW